MSTLSTTFPLSTTLSVDLQYVYNFYTTKFLGTDFTNDFRPTDVIIPVLGTTGSGKSSFVAAIVRGQANVRIPIIGHDQHSCTKHVEGFLYNHMPSGRRVLLLDCPGFDDSTGNLISDVTTLQEIALVLCRAYHDGISVVAGVLYLHRITANRLGNTGLRSLGMMKGICGKAAYQHVALVTTYWDKIAASPKHDEDMRTSAAHERELFEDYEFFGDMIDEGSRMMRWTGDLQSAVQIIDTLMERYQDIGNSGIDLQIQRELVSERKSLEETAVVEVVDEQILKMLRTHRRAKEDLQREYAVAMQKKQVDFEERSQDIKFEQSIIESLESSRGHLRVQLGHLSAQLARENQSRLAADQRERNHANQRQERKSKAQAYALQGLKVLAGAGGIVAGSMTLQPAVTVAGAGLFGSGVANIVDIGMRKSGQKEYATQGATPGQRLHMGNGFGMVLANDGVEHALDADNKPETTACSYIDSP